jgi:hypothetical protein
LLFIEVWSAIPSLLRLTANTARSNWVGQDAVCFYAVWILNSKLTR